MSNQVYANGMEVSCKAASGKAICSFPDVCFTEHHVVNGFPLGAFGDANACCGVALRVRVHQQDTQFRGGERS